MTAPAVAAPPVSDDFHSGTLNTSLWTLVDPLGDGTFSMNGTNAVFSLPAGAPHDVWIGGNNSLRIMQSITNVDFEVEQKFETAPTTQFQLQGIIVEQDASNYIRFEVHHDGSSPKLFIATFVGGTPGIRLNTGIAAAGPPFWIRVKRQVNDWTFSTSTNGTTFTPAITFTEVYTISKIGPYAGNTGPPPANTVRVDYFFNTASPIVPEDGGGDVTPPQITNIVATPAATSAQITWTTDESANSRVDFGTTTTYGTNVTDPAFVTSHTLNLTSLVCNTLYNYKVTSADTSTNSASSINLTFTTSACPAAGSPESDDFAAASLNPRWVFGSQLGDGSVGLATAGVEKTADLTVPAGTVHDSWTGANNAIRILQNISNSDFTVEAKWNSAVTTASQIQGIQVEATPGNYIRFDVFNSGAGPRLFAASFVANSPTARINTAIAVTSPIWLRVTRAANNWTLFWSSNGTTFTNAGTFAHTLAVSKIGPFAGNAGGSPPAFVSKVDYFFNTASPIAPEDPTDSDPPVITNPSVAATSTSATVTWTTDEPATSRVDYGTTTAYGSTQNDAALVTGHSVNLPGLTCGTLYNYRITSIDAGNNSASTTNATFRPACPLVSDDFHSGSLNPALWTFVNPLGDGSFSVNGTQLLLSVPVGVTHDVWIGGNNAPRIVQPIPSQDFEAELKYESAPSARFQLQGVLVEQDGGNYFRLEIYHDGSTARMLAVSFVNGAPTVLGDSPIASAGPPVWLRVKKLGTAWTFSASTDGTNFTQAINFTSSMNPMRLGPYAGNTGSPPPAFTSTVDYVFNTASPIVPEDGGQVDMTPPIISGIQSVVSASAATVTWTTDEASTSQVNYGTTTAYGSSIFKGAAVIPHSIAIGSLTCNTLYHFKVTSVDAANNSASSPDGTFTTSACGTSGAGPISDDYHTPALNGFWTFLDPVGDGTFSLDGTRLNLVVPTGAGHDAWTGGNRSVRLMQPTANLDLQVEVKFESPVTTATQMQGILAEQDANNYLRFDVFHDGTTPRIFAGTISGGTGTARFNFGLAGTTAPYWLRLKRFGDAWEFSYSTNGTTFTGLGTFMHPMTLTKIGPFAGNSGTNPAFTALVDYFFNTDAPIVPEDDGTPPLITNIVAAPAATTANISWTTDEAATSTVDFGLTTAYGSTAADPTLVTSHLIGLSGLTCNTLYHYKVSSVDLGGNTGSTSDMTFTSGSCSPPGSPVSDDFRLPGLNGFWAFVNPLGDGSVGLSGTTERTADLVLPAGSSHDVWAAGNQAIRLMQNIGNIDFEIEVKWLTAPTVGSQMQGIIVEASPGNYLRFDLMHDGSTPRVFAASFVNNSPTVRVNTPIAGIAAPLWMRIKRLGNTWTESYSTNGTTFTQAVSFSHTLTVTKLGPFAGNFKSPPPAPAFTSMVDYFFNVFAPIVPEDAPPDPTPPQITNVAATPSVTTASITWTTDEPATSRVDYGLTTNYGANVTDPALVSSHSVGLTSLTCNTLYHYMVTSLDAAGNPASSVDQTFTTNACPPPPVISNVVATPGVTTASITWTTDITATSRVDYGATTAYGTVASDPALVTSHSVPLQGLSCNTLYHYMVTSVGASSSSASTADMTFMTDPCPPLQITNVAAAPGATSAQITWTTNTTASSRVDYGLTTNYGANVTDPALLTNHSVPISGLTCNTVYNYMVSSTDAGNTTESSTNLTFTTGSCLPAGSPVSDDFRLPGLNGFWAFVNPLGDGSVNVSGTTERTANLVLPAGSSHDVWAGGNQSIRILQNISNIDFEIEVKWLTAPSVGSQLQGIIVEASPGNYLRFDIFHDGASPRIFAASFVNNSPTIRANTAIPGTVAPVWMRIKRLGNTWTESYSTNGINFTQAVSFSHTLAVTKVGPFAGNFKSPPPAPAFTSMVDYFFNTLAPIVPEDGPPDSTAPQISGVNATPSLTSATIGWTTDEPATSRVDYGLTTNYGANVTDPALVSNHSVGLTSLTCNTLYHYMVTSLDAAGNPASSVDQTFTTNSCPPPPVISNVVATPDLTTASITWTTDLAATSRVDYGTTTAYGTVASDPALVTSHSVPLQGLLCNTLYHYMVTSVSAASSSASTGDQTFMTDPCPPLQITNVVAAPGATSAQITWTTNTAASSRVDYGLTTSYGANVTDPALLTSHSIPIPGLTCNTLYNFMVSSTDAGNTTVSSANLTFTTLPCTPPGSPVSDDFRNPGLNASLWSFVNPLGDGSVNVSGTTERTANLVLPAGSSHDVWAGGNQSIRILQGISNIDFEIEVKWLTAPSVGSQLQGIIVEASAGNYLRFDIFHDGASPRVFAASFVNNSPTIRVNTAIPGTVAPVWMRIKRLGNTWTESYSTNGSTFTQAVSFSHTLAVTKVGPFAGNFKSSPPAPTFTSMVDYFFNTIAPIVPEDGPPDSTAPQISGVNATPSVASATIGWTTDEPATSRVDYGLTTNYGANVTDPALVTSHSVGLALLTCNTLYHYLVTSLDGAGNPASSGDQTFMTSACPPAAIISNIVATPGSTTASITWTTNIAATSRVDYGTTTAYGTMVNDTALVTNHSIPLQELFCNTVYHYKVTSLNSANVPSSSGDLTFITTGCPVGVISDDFRAGSLNTGLWSFVNPLGDGSVSVSGTTNRVLNLVLPSGNNHDLWTTGNNAIRIMQTIPNQDFEVEVKFESTVTVRSQLQGVLVEASPGNYVRFGIYFDGVVPRLFSASFTNNVPAVRENSGLCIGSGPFWLRVKRVGNNWTQSWSTIGTNFTPGVTFSHPLTVTKIGPYAGNVGSGGPAPAFTAVVDYFFNTTSPILPEDGVALDGGAGLAQGGADPLDDAAHRSDLFGPPGPTIDVWYGDTQTFGDKGKPQQWVNILGNIHDPDGVSTLRYTLNGGSQQTLAIGPNITRLVDPGDFNVEIDYASLVPGSNPVVLTATDGLGNVSTRTVTINYVNGPSWPRSYSINWSTAPSIQAVSQIVDGKWAIQPDGTVRTTQVGYDRLIAVGDMTTWNDYEVVGEITMNSLDCGYDFGVGFVVGWKGHNGSGQPRDGHPFPGLGWYAKFQGTNYFLNIYENTPTNVEHIMVQDNSGRTLPLGVKHIFKFRTQTISATKSRYSLKVWVAGTAEPVNFDLVADGDRTVGSLVLGAHRADVNFGPITVTGL